MLSPFGKLVFHLISLYYENVSIRHAVFVEAESFLPGRGVPTERVLAAKNGLILMALSAIIMKLMMRVSQKVTYMKIMAWLQIG